MNVQNNPITAANPNNVPETNNSDWSYTEVFKEILFGSYLMPSDPKKAANEFNAVYFSTILNGTAHVVISVAVGFVFNSPATVYGAAVVGISVIALTIINNVIIHKSVNLLNGLSPLRIVALITASHVVVSAATVLAGVAFGFFATPHVIIFSILWSAKPIILTVEMIRLYYAGVR